MKHVRAFTSKATRTRIELATRLLSRHRTGGALALGPNRACLDELIFEVTREHGATYGVHRKTLGGLATECAALALAAADKAPARPAVLDALARSVAREAFAEGVLAHFGRSASSRSGDERLAPRGDRSGSSTAVAQTPGFAIALARTLGELDREDLSQERLATLGPGGRDLGDLLARLRTALEDKKLATRADVTRAAASSFEGSPLAGLPVAMLDVPLHTNVDRLLAQRILERAREATVIVPTDDERTLRALSEMGITVEPAAAEDASLELGAFRSRLFAVDQDTFEPLRGEDVTLRAAPTEALEAIEIARIVIEESRRGVAFDEVAVLVPSRETYASHLVSAFGRAGIPVELEAGTRRPHPAGRALLALLACRSERGSGRRLLEYLSTSQMPRTPLRVDRAVATSDEDLGRFGADADGRPAESLERKEDEEDDETGARFRAPPLKRWIRTLREIGVFGAGLDGTIAGYVRQRVGVAKQELEAAVAAIVREEGEPASATDRARKAEAPELPRIRDEIERLDDLVEGLGPVLEHLDRIPLRGTWGDFIAALRALSAVALRRPELVLSVLDELDPIAKAPQEIDLDEVSTVLSPRFRWLERPGAKADDEGRARVVVTTPGAIRGRARRVVVVAGLAEGLFPARTREDPLLLDEARARVALPTAAERTANERLALALAAGAARERLYFTYPRLEVETGRPRVPSVYALEVARATSGRLPGLAELERSARPPSRVLLAWPAPRDPALAIDELERTLAVVRDRLGRSDEDMRGRARFLIESHPLLMRALRARWMRHDQPRFTTGDGFVATTPTTRRALESYRLTTRAYAPSALEAYAACPYRFYLRSIARLSPRATVEATDRLDPRIFGDLYHRCQALLGTRLAQLDLDPQDPASAHRVVGEIRDVTRTVAEAARLKLEPILTGVFEDEMARIESDLIGWAEEEIAVGDGFRPYRSDLAFGLPRHEHAPESTEEDVRISGGYRLKGAIDSVERDAHGRLRVTDYKTGRVPEERERGFAIIGHGEMLQPLLYALAVEALRGRGVAADGVVVKSRLLYATRRGGYTAVPVAVASDNVAKARRVLDLIDGAVERGLFFAAPRERACEHCDYRPVCGPNEEMRTRRKEPGATAVEHQLFESLRDVRGIP